MTPRIVFRSILLFALLIGVGAAIKLTPLGSVLDEGWIDTYVRGEGIRGELIFLGAGALFTAAGLPRQAVAFMAGYAFGIAWGTLISVIAAALGCILTFVVARFLARDLVAHKFPDKLMRMDAFLSENTFTTTLLIRFLPVGSNVLTNMLAGVSRAHAVPFVAGSAIGYIPQMLIFALVGSGFAVEPGVRLVISIILFAASGVLGVWLYRRYRDSHRLLNAGVVDAEDVGASEAAEK
ncbi:VTT domain-containing protein [Thalassospiraceae bacterium LMO-JJ14]|nr:VTT domain-containing protein [Thalassospiraceae bacterium LMO-JJ14]